VGRYHVDDVYQHFSILSLSNVHAKLTVRLYSRPLTVRAKSVTLSQWWLVDLTLSWMET
jgi:hypothetical protein